MLFFTDFWMLSFKSPIASVCLRASSSPDSSHFLGLHLESPHKTTSSSCGGGCASLWPHRKYAHRENTLAGTGKYLGWHERNTDVGKTQDELTQTLNKAERELDELRK